MQHESVSRYRPAIGHAPARGIDLNRRSIDPQTGEQTPILQPFRDWIALRLRHSGDQLVLEILDRASVSIRVSLPKCSQPLPIEVARIARTGTRERFLETPIGKRSEVGVGVGSTVSGHESSVKIRTLAAAENPEVRRPPFLRAHSLTTLRLHSHPQQ